jgi:phosphomannomutase
VTSAEGYELSVHRRLFGTSGIRGVYSPDATGDPVAAFAEQNILTPEFVYRFAHALAALYKESKNPYPLEIWRDVRASGPVLVNSLARGLLENSIPVIDRGIAPTTLYTIRNTCWAVVVTASHNPVEFNGLKLFREGRPLERPLERQIESIMADKTRKETTGTAHTAVSVHNGEWETRRIQMDYLETETRPDMLRRFFQSRDDSFFLPLDLAYGAAACPVDSHGIVTAISPQLAVLLKLGCPVVGYGCLQDPIKTNDRIGAAYAYGETASFPEPFELKAFSRGKYGYGAPADRIIFLPEHTRIPFITGREFPAGHMAEDVLYTLDMNGSPVTVILIDHPGMPSALKTALEMDIARRKALPGLTVDCDADRLLVTTPRIASSAVPYMTGDAMIRLFAETAPPETYDEVVFTIESGLAVDAALEHCRMRHKKEGFHPFDIRKVTVGDRAIIDSVLEAGPGMRLGGEPSGHIIFHERSESVNRLIDDPFVTYLNLLDRTMQMNRDLDTILNGIFREVPELYCARKPDSMARTGLLPGEKAALELWEENQWGHLSRYAAEFIPVYLSLYGAMLGSVFNWGQPERITFSEEWLQLKQRKIDLPYDGWQMPLARLQFQAIITEAFLYLDRREWAGPDVIRIAFYTLTPAGDRIQTGEGVFRNSGTGPRNAGYHKLWMQNPVTGECLSNETLRDVLTGLAVKRARFTDDYVDTVLRNPSNP